MLAAEKGQREMCVRLVELGADLNKADRVSETCFDCMTVCCCMIIMLTLFFELVGTQDGIHVCC